jgi:two-component system sensor histidine kinase/response regulator
MVAIGQTAFSALLIHLTGGRIETHFHVFGSLAFLACYRDWRVILTATAVVIVDHLVRGIYFPFSVYGVELSSLWRVLEHAVWVFFEDIVLIWSCFVSRRETRRMCDEQFANQSLNVDLELKVSKRTGELEAEIRTRKEAEEVIRTSEERYRTLVNSSPQYILSTDREGRIQFLNRVAPGIKLEEAMGALIYNHIPKRYHVQVRDTIERVFTTGETGAYEIEATGPNGTWAFYSTVVAPVKTGEKVTSVILIANDITERKKAESDLVRAKEAAEAGNRAKSDFLATMSHEIRTPMNGVIGFTNLLLETPLNNEQKEFCEIIKKSGEGLLELINDILEFSKLEASKVKLEKRLFDLHSAVQTAVAFVSRKAADKKLKLVINFSEASNVKVVSDEIRLRQVLLNLLDNAIKFTASGKVTLDLQVESCRKQLFKFRFSVSDTGIGIPQDKLDRLFQKFTQIDASTKRRFGGTGLGLAISKQLAELMGGEMGVESQLGQGSTFWFTLPLEVESDGENLALSREKSLAVTRSVAPLEDAGRARILVAEDNPVNRLVLVRMLEKMRFTVALAEDGKEAVQKYRPELYDCVLMDCNMPNMDGYEATSLIRQSEKQDEHIPIIAVTANAMNGDRERCLAAGMDDYISKPIQRPELERLLAKYLSKSQPVGDA